MTGISMRPNRPTAVLVIAILNIILGVCGIICGVCGGATLAAMTRVAPPERRIGVPGGAPNLRSFMEEKIPGWFFLELSKAGLVLVLSLILIASGIGLLAMRAWARALTIVYAGLSFLLHSSYLVFQFGFVIPAVQEWNKQVQGGLPTDPAAQGREVGAVIGVLLAAGINIVYAAVVSLVMFLPQVAEAFAHRKVEQSDSNYGF